MSVDRYLPHAVVLTEHAQVAGDLAQRQRGVGVLTGRPCRTSIRADRSSPTASRIATDEFRAGLTLSR